MVKQKLPLSKHAGRAFGLWVVMVAGMNLGLAQSLTWLGTLGGNMSYASGVSADGCTVVGMSENTWGRTLAFRWTVATGMQDLGTLGGMSSIAKDVSADGSVVIGIADAGIWSTFNRAFRWTQSEGMVDLGSLGGVSYQSSGFSVSADGTVIVGRSQDSRGVWRGFRWENWVMHPLGDGGSSAASVSINGNVVVGDAPNADGHSYAFRWTQSEGMQNLGTLPGGGSSSATDVSADGNTVVGVAFDANIRQRPVRWWYDGIGWQIQDLGTLGGNNGWAMGVTADGNVVVGSAQHIDSRSRAFRWRQGEGLEDLNVTYAGLLTGGSGLGTASAISPDGRYIVGSGYNAATGRSEGFLLDTWRSEDTNGDGCIDDADLLNLLFAFGTPGSGLTRHEDVNKDGIVDDADLLIVLFSFGSGC